MTLNDCNVAPYHM